MANKEIKRYSADGKMILTVYLNEDDGGYLKVSLQLLCDKVLLLNKSMGSNPLLSELPTNPDWKEDTDKYDGKNHLRCKILSSGKRVREMIPGIMKSFEGIKEWYESEKVRMKESKEALLEMFDKFNEDEPEESNE